MNGAKNWLNGSIYDLNGNVTTLNNSTLGYDMENRLSSYPTGTFLENYAYDEGGQPNCDDVLNLMNSASNMDPLGIGSSNGGLWGSGIPGLGNPYTGATACNSFPWIQPWILWQLNGGGGGVTWSSLSETCKQALETAHPGRGSSEDIASWTGAINRAIASEATLKAAASGTHVGWMMLAAIAVRESNFSNVIENDGAGVGVGVFQITVSAKSGVSFANAENTAWSATWAANYLSTNMDYLDSKFPNLNSAQILQATAASYNFGPGNISGNPATIDVGSAHNNYGSNVLAIMNCFQ